MTNHRSGLGSLLVGVMLAILAFVVSASAQSPRTIDTGTTVTVRTNQDIYTSSSDGRVYSATVDQDVASGRGVSIPRGAEVELLVRDATRNEVALDLDSVVVNGQRYALQTDESVVGTVPSQGIGANKRTGTFVGGGAAIGAIVGAIVGGGKGAAIGGGIGAAAGASAQIMTRGSTVSVPAGSLLTFRLQRPLQAGAQDSGYNRYGQHYHPGGYQSNPGTSPAYQDGMRAGTADSERYATSNPRSNRWTRQQDMRDYQEGYRTGYDGTAANMDHVFGSVNIGSDHMVRWEGPSDARIFVQVDNNKRQLFGSGPTGYQTAPWITRRHFYVFVMVDGRGNEIARDQLDLR